MTNRNTAHFAKWRKSQKICLTDLIAIHREILLLYRQLKKNGFVEMNYKLLLNHTTAETAESYIERYFKAHDYKVSRWKLHANSLCISF